MEYNQVDGRKMMNINVQLFSPLKEFSGASRVALELPEPATAADMIEVLAARYPAMLPFLRNAQVVINDDMVGRLQLLQEGDEVQLRVPMFGG